MTQPSDTPALVKRDTMLLVGLGCLVVGFLAGVIFSSFQEPAVPPSAGPQQHAGPAPAPGAGGLAPGQADRILALEREVAANPNNADAWAQLGNIWFDTGKYGKAIEAYEKSLAIKPDNPDVWTDLGVMYRRSGKPDKAIECFDRAIAIDPKHDTPYFNKGIVQIFDLKDVEAGLASWEELVRINPGAMAPNGQPVSALIAEFRNKQKAQQQQQAGEKSASQMGQ
ncbi:MAG TPA: tetratricopeptide repeat protein [Desulfobacterales bacterium]|nr:tetratricopeptide repeat protein [Desulfobacterales bacterium]